MKIMDFYYNLKMIDKLTIVNGFILLMILFVLVCE